MKLHPLYLGRSLVAEKKPTRAVVGGCLILPRFCTIGVVTKLFAGKYRVETVRMHGWDYSNTGYYFITICTKDRVCWFGNIVDGEIRLSEIGEIVIDEWRKTERIRWDVKFDEWVVMPNHIHGIVIIINGCDANRCRDVARYVSTGENTMSRISPKPRSLSAIIRSFKSAATKRIHETGCKKFFWQARFHNHVIGNEKSLDRIRQYIVNNPRNWSKDRNNPGPI